MAQRTTKSKEEIAKLVAARMLGDQLAGKPMVMLTSRFNEGESGMRPARQRYIDIKRSKKEIGGSLTVWISGEDHKKMRPWCGNFVLVGDSDIYIIQGEGIEGSAFDVHYEVRLSMAIANAVTK